MSRVSGFDKSPPPKGRRENKSAFKPGRKLVGVPGHSSTRQLGVPGLVGPRDAVDARVLSTWAKCKPRLVDVSLWTFNMITWCACIVMIAGQVGTLWELGLGSPELVLLALSVVGLWVLTMVGMYGTTKKNRTALRLYAFMLLVLVLAQTSILWELINNLDSSFTDQFSKVIRSLCLLDTELIFGKDDEQKQYYYAPPKIDDSWSGSGSGQGGVRDGEISLLDQLCGCTELAGPRHCVSVWIHENFYYASIFFACLFGLEGSCATLAWTYVDRLENAEAATLARIRRVTEGNRGSAWGGIQDRFKAGLNLGADMQAKVRREAALLTQTWYFESTVLFASIVMFVVLALQSKTVAPDVSLNAVLRIGEVFVTLFLTVDVTIQIGVCMTPAQRRRIPKQPWVLLDIVALISSWMYLVWAPLRVFSIGRVLRVLRPMRTLRMFSEINTVLETIVEALPLFFQACFLIFFLQMVFALICMSLWSGGLTYECQEDETVRNLNTNGSWDGTLSLGEQREAFQCPNALDCTTGDDEWELTYCTKVSPPRYIRSEGYGFTGFDDFLQAMLTMFVQMTGDNGMQDIPFALQRSGVALSGLGWSLMLAAVLVLTLLALNLFLAVCCAVFDDVHEKIFAKAHRVIDRDAGYTQGTFTPSTTSKGGGMLALMKEITAATQQAISANDQNVADAEQKLKSTEEKYIEYMNGIKANDWTKPFGRSRMGKYRNMCRFVVCSKHFIRLVNAMVVVNAMILMSAHHNMSAEWMTTNVLLESICLLFFWAEVIFKVFGFGFGVYIESNTHRLDLFILLCTSAGFLASVLTLVATVLPATVPGYDMIGRGLHTLTSIRLVRLMRALQMSRWIYSRRQMRELLETVFKSWESVLLIGIFTLFSLVMFAVVNMHLLGGSLGPDATMADYPRRNVETIGESFAVTFNFLTGESWSSVMYFYMKHSDLPPYTTALYFVVQYIWMRCLLFSLFVAVLLVNFAVDEDDKMPRQKIKFDREEAHKEKNGLNAGSLLVKALNQESMADEVKVKKKTSFDVLTDYNLAHPYTHAEGEPRDPERCSLNFFDITHPFRMFCARIESKKFFEDIVMWMVMASAIVIAFESPELMAEYGLFFDLFNLALLVLFYLQMGMRMVIHGAYKKSGPTLPYMKNSLNNLDIFVIVVVTLTYALPSHKVLRLIRVMAPLLELMRNDSVRTLVNTFALSLPAVGAILFLLTILFSVFGIVGVEYFGGRLYRCVYADSIYSVVPGGLNRTVCDVNDDYLWENPPWNFDNIFTAGVALYYMCINAGWAEIMESTLDITDVDQAPVFENSAGFWVYYALFHITFSLFLLNLFIGVLSSAFSSQSGSNLITSLQQRWIRILSMLDSFRPESSGIDRPETGVRFWKVRQKMWDLAEDKRVEVVWTSAILFNVALLVLDHYPAQSTWMTFLEISNVLCLLIFTAEIVLKVGAYTLFGFLSTGWHQVDMFVVLGSWASRFTGVKSGVGVIRAFRTVRLTLLVKRLPSLMALMNTVLACVYPAIDITAISFLIFYLYAIIGMKLFGDAPTDLKYYNEDTNFVSFFSTLRLLFQQINGQDMKTMVYDLNMAGYGMTTPFLYLSSFFFLIVFICINLFIVTVLDNFANLCSMDDTLLTMDDMETFAECWHHLTFGTLWEVDPNEVGIVIDDALMKSLDGDAEAMAKVFKEKHDRETDIRLRRWSELKRSYPKAPYFEDQDAAFEGWLHRPNILAKATAGLLKLNDMRYFWIDSECFEPGEDGHLCLNWFAEGTSERDLDSKFGSATGLKIERVKIAKVVTELPPVKLVRQKTAQEKAAEDGFTDADGHVNKIAAAISGRAWLVSLANAQSTHPDNAMAACFKLDYYEESLAEQDPELLDGLKSPRAKELAEEEDLTPLQARFRQCIEMGIQIPTNKGGCYAVLGDDYDVFWPFYKDVLELLHGVRLSQENEIGDDELPFGIISYLDVLRSQGNDNAKQIQKRWDIHSAYHADIPALGNLDLTEHGVKGLPVSLSASRNLDGFNLIGGMVEKERLTAEDLLFTVINQFLRDPHWRGKYYSLTPGHPNEIEPDEHLELVKDDLMFPAADKSAEMGAGGLTADWPAGRGCYVSADEETVIWVGYEDHVKVFSKARSATNLNVVMGSLKEALDVFEESSGVKFQHRRETCGYITSSPERSGTGMQFSAQVKLPKLTLDGTVDKVRNVIKERNLEVDIAEGCDHDADSAWGHFDVIDNDELDEHGRFEIVVNRTFGVSEAQIACMMYSAIKHLHESEDAEQVFGGGDKWWEVMVGKAMARFQRKANQAQKLIEQAQAEAEKQALQAVKVAQMAADAAQEAAQDAADRAQVAAADAQEAAQGVGSREADITIGVGNIDLTELDLPGFLNTAAQNPLAIVLDVVPVDCTTVKKKNGDESARLVLIADSREQHAAWVRALKWLEGGCVEDMHLVRHDRRMYPGGIPPRPLNDFETAKLKANVGLLDMPFSSVRTMLHMLQHKQAMGVTQAFSREYALWVTFQLEIYTFQTQASDMAQRMSGIEHAIEACDGCNFGKVLQSMCMIRTGRVNSLPYRQQVETFNYESEFVALRIIQTVVGAWVALKAREKFGNNGTTHRHPHHPFWQHHPNIYKEAVLACRDQRLRTLGLLLKLVRRQQPMISTADFLMKEAERQGPAVPTQSSRASIALGAGLGAGGGLLSKVKKQGVESAEGCFSTFEVEGGFGDPMELDSPPMPAPRPVVQSAPQDDEGESRADAALSLLASFDQTKGDQAADEENQEGTTDQDVDDQEEVENPVAGGFRLGDDGAENESLDEV